MVTRDRDYVADGALTISDNLDSRLTKLAESNTVFIIGGADLFVRLIDNISILHLTRITGNYDCDTFLPFDLIDDKFSRIDRITVDKMTIFETYFARKLHDLSFTTEF